MSPAPFIATRSVPNALPLAGLALLKEAVCHHAAGRTAAAIVPLDRFLQQVPHHFDALQLRGQLALAQQDHDTALRSYSTAISLQPLNPIPYYNLGLCLQALGNPEEAQRLYEMALDLKPDLVPVLNNLGLVLRQQQRFEAALARFEQAISLDPSYPFSYVNRSGLRVRQHRLQEALSDCNTAIQLQRDYVDAWFTEGFVLSESLRYEEAIAAYQYVLALAPDHAKAAFALAVTWLLQGDFAAGWPQYEARWKNPELGLHRLAAKHEEWDGHVPLAGRRVLVYFEQGLGDTLQFARFVPRLADLAPRSGCWRSRPCARCYRGWIPGSRCWTNCRPPHWIWRSPCSACPTDWDCCRNRICMPNPT
ncbi:tetratricopeptide repeat protein [Pseudaeromonas sp. ZJS20]|uniref:tetratricopeptide repeat protein n=1 Tax=Pseudaeromonas aegiceratis TaxID=3153928 RepID=UPI00390C82E7